MTRHPDHPAELAVKLIIALADFAAFLYFARLDVATSATVNPWLFVAFLAILGAMLGVDILRDMRGIGNA